MECLHCQQYFSAKPKEQFCCRGCEIVYNAFQKNGLADYYKYKNTVTSSIDEKEIKNNYLYLDQPQLKEQYNKGDKVELSFFIEELHCLACVWFFERLPSLDHHILKSEILFNSNTLKLTLKKETQLSRIATLIASFGYKVHLIDEDKRADIELKSRRVAINRIVIAFFSLGNIMLLSVSVYSGASGFFEKYFNLLCGLLSLPVIFYSCIPFFKNFYFAIQKRSFSIDIPITLALIIGYSASFIGIFQNTEMVYFDSLTMLVFLLLLSRFILDQVKKSVEQKLNHNNFFSKIIANRIVNDSILPTMARYIKKDDSLKLDLKDTVAADGIIINGESYFDTSLINGESNPTYLSSGDTVQSGMINLSQEVKIKVTSDYQDSLLGKLEQDLIQNSGAKNQYSQLALLSSKFFFYLAIILCSIILLTIRPWDVALERLIAIVVITCPCALGLVVPLTMIIGLRGLNQKGIFVKNESSILNVKKIKNVFLDKTGTLTKTNFDFTFDYKVSDIEYVHLILYSLEKLSSHPIALEYCKQFSIDDSIVFDSFNESHGELIAIKDQDKYKISTQRQESRTSFTLSKNDKVLVQVYVTMEYREDAKGLVRYLKNQDLAISLLSGDNKTKVEEAASYFDIDQYFSELDPTQKQEIISNHRNTLMIGDGVNDTLSMRTSDISIAVNTSVDFAQKCADIYLAIDNLDLVRVFIKDSLHIDRVLKRAIIISSILNMIYIYFAWIGYISPFMAAILMPLTSLSLLLFSLFSLREKKINKMDKTDKYHVLESKLKLN